MIAPPDQDTPPSPDPRAERATIFRREALDHHAWGRHDAHVLQITPAWTHRAYWLLAATCAFALLYALAGQVTEHAGGSAVLRAEGRIDVTAHQAGTVDTVAVRPGTRVRAGQLLARLHSGAEAAALRRFDHELELHLVRLLRDPADDAARGALTALRAERELALARLEERLIRAPRDGVIGDLRIRPGQQLQPGDLVLSLDDEGAGFRVIAMLPGHYRPLLRPGMPLRLELEGYPHAVRTVPIHTVSDSAVGPAELLRYLGPAAVDTAVPRTATVLVEARLPARSFSFHGMHLDFHEGMQARAEVPVRSERILWLLLPGLRAITGDPG